MVREARTVPGPITPATTPCSSGGALRTSAMARQTQNKLEAFLDRLEHGELRLPEKKQEWHKRLGM